MVALSSLVKSLQIDNFYLTFHGYGIREMGNGTKTKKNKNKKKLILVCLGGKCFLSKKCFC
jgi:5-deoxy-D-glucuronate isomerase